MGDIRDSRLWWWEGRGKGSQAQFSAIPQEPIGLTPAVTSGPRRRGNCMLGRKEQ